MHASVRGSRAASNIRCCPNSQILDALGGVPVDTGGAGDFPGTLNTRDPRVRNDTLHALSRDSLQRYP